MAGKVFQRVNECLFLICFFAASNDYTMKYQSYSRSPVAAEGAMPVEGESPTVMVKVSTLALTAPGAALVIRGLANRAGKCEVGWVTGACGRLLAARLAGAAGSTTSETKPQNPIKCQNTIPEANPRTPQRRAGERCRLMGDARGAPGATGRLVRGCCWTDADRGIGGTAV